MERDYNGMDTEKELEDIGDFISAAITKVTRPNGPTIGQFADRDQKQGDAIDHSVRTGEPLFATRCETVAISTGNEDTATLSIRDNSLWLTLKTPRGDATFNLKYVLQSIGNGRGVFAKTPSVAERVTLDYFRRLSL